MTLAFIPSDAVMLAVQAGVVAAPRPIGRPKWLERFHGVGWAVVPIGSIVLVIFAIRYLSDTATALSDLALVAVPMLAAVALAWAGRGARVWAAAGAPALFAVAWAEHRTLTGEGAATLLSALSCVTLGVLLAAITPPRWLKLGILAMAAADTWLVVSDLLQAPNATLVAAHPPGGLPRLQSEIFGSVTMGYGDLFVAGLLGAIYAADRRRQLGAALLTFVIAGLFDLLFLAVDELPATVPVALALLVVEVGDRVRLGASASRRRSPPAVATPRQVR